MTTSTSLISFRLEEMAKSLTTGRGKWLLVHVRAADDVQADLRLAAARSSRRPDHGDRRGDGGLRHGGGQGRRRGSREGLRAKRGIKVYDLDQAERRQVEAIARDTCWKDYAGKSASNAEFLKLVEAGGLTGRACDIPRARSTLLKPNAFRLPARARPSDGRSFSRCRLALLWRCVLTYGVVAALFTPEPTDWQDEFSVFMLIGVTFLSAAWVHSQRGHIGIEAVASILSPRHQSRPSVRRRHAERSCSAPSSPGRPWTLLHKAWVEGQRRAIAWAPPLWIPYLAMSARHDAPDRADASAVRQRPCIVSEPEAK